MMFTSTRKVTLVACCNPNSAWQQYLVKRKHHCFLQHLLALILRLQLGSGSQNIKHFAAHPCSSEPRDKADMARHNYCNCRLSQLENQSRIQTIALSLPASTSKSTFRLEVCSCRVIGILPVSRIAWQSSSNKRQGLHKFLAIHTVVKKIPIVIQEPNFKEGLHTGILMADHTFTFHEMHTFKIHIFICEF